MMKWLLLPFLFLVVTALPAQHNLDITITGLKNKGKLLMGIYNSQENFLKKEGMFRHAVQEVSGKEMVVRIEDMPSGEYSLAFMIDTNGNDKMDYYFFGLPKEKYGFYPDPGIIFSLPEFDEIKFTLERDLQVVTKAK